MSHISQEAVLLWSILGGMVYAPLGFRKNQLLIPVKPQLLIFLVW